jgi:hypothetical protein
MRAKFTPAPAVEKVGDGSDGSGGGGGGGGGSGSDDGDEDAYEPWLLGRCSNK